jgi:dihydroflavonol-4-reductase
MKNVIVTGPSNFLAYHIIKLLNNGGIRPRVLLRVGGGEVTRAVKELRKLNIEEREGDVQDLPSLKRACEGVDTVLHMDFMISVGGGTEIEKSLYDVNVVGTRNVLDAATYAKVARVVVSSSSLTVGLSRDSKPIDETADWAVCGIGLPYALSRRQAELETLARPGGAGLPIVVAVNPSLTMGPEDFEGAPLNSMVKVMAKRLFWMTVPIGSGVLDVRDFADAVLRAAESGRHGRRYLISGENLTPEQLLNEISSVSKVRTPGFLLLIHAWMVYPIIRVHEMWCKLTGRTPKATLALLQLWGRNAWYDTSLARAELGWKPRPLRESLNDTIDWLLRYERN